MLGDVNPDTAKHSDNTRWVIDGRSAAFRDVIKILLQCANIFRQLYVSIR